jgi:hypothetical protein
MLLSCLSALIDHLGSDSIIIISFSSYGPCLGRCIASWMRNEACEQVLVLFVTSTTACYSLSGLCRTSLILGHES